MSKVSRWLPPVVADFGARLAAKALGLSPAAWARGDDVVDGTATRLAQPYAQSGMVFAAVNLKSGEFTGLPLKFYQGDDEIADLALAAWWARPALGPNGKRIDRATVDKLLSMWLDLEGEFFLLLDDSWVVNAGRQVAGYAPFIVARPDRVRLIVQGATLAGYEYIDAGGRRSVYVPEQVVHVMEPNPYDDWRGLGRQQVARVATESVFLTGVYIRDLMRNNGDQGMIVIGKSGVIGDPQRDQITAGLRAKRAALQRGVAKDLFLTGDITVDHPEQQAASVDLTNTQALSCQQIFLAFSVPPSMSAVKQAYSIGKDSDRYQLITGASQPRSREICGAYAELAGRQLRRDVTAEHDWDDHPVMQEVRNARLDAAIKLWECGMSWETVNDYLDLGMSAFRGWDVAYLPFSVAPVGDGSTPPTVDPNQPAIDPVADPALAEPAVEDADVAKIRLLVLARARSRQCVNVTPKNDDADGFAMFACSCPAHLTLGAGSIAWTQRARSARELAQWRTLMGKRRETVKSFEGAFGRVLMVARQETLRRLEAALLPEKSKGQTPAPVVTRAAAADIIFDLAKFADSFLAAMRDRQKVALDTAGKQLFAELGKDDAFKYPPAEVLDFLTGRQNKLRDVPTQIHEEIKAAIEEGIVAGDSTELIAQRVRAAFNGVSDQRSRRIALTETSAAYGAGRDQAMTQAGVQLKRWLTSGNANVRAAHAEANGQTVAIDEPFEVDGEQLMYPGDEAGSAGNVINCHCVSIAVAKE